MFMERFLEFWYMNVYEISFIVVVILSQVLIYKSNKGQESLVYVGKDNDLKRYFTKITIIIVSYLIVLSFIPFGPVLLLGGIFTIFIGYGINKAEKLKKTKLLTAQLICFILMFSECLSILAYTTFGNIFMIVLTIITYILLNFIYKLKMKEYNSLEITIDLDDNEDKFIIDTINEYKIIDVLENGKYLYLVRGYRNNENAISDFVINKEIVKGINIKRGV